MCRSHLSLEHPWGRCSQWRTIWVWTKNYFRLPTSRPEPRRSTSNFPQKYAPPHDCKGKAKGRSTDLQMYAAFKWRAVSPGHDELRCVLFLINGTVIADHFREQVSSTPLGTVRSS